MNDAAELQRAAVTLRRRGKTFAFAARLLPQESRDTATRLYAACRAIDDLADRDGGPEARRRLRRLLLTQWRGDDPDPLAQTLHALSTERGISAAAIRDLVRGALNDTGRVRIADSRELVEYAYRVAGSVGLMMSAALGAVDPRARAHAIDLGIAMQLTNIARDVLEDAEMGRRYLPGEWCPLEPSDIRSGAPDVRAVVSGQVLRLLDLADAYYASGRAGYVYLPFRSRVGVAAAARSYRAIGERLRHWRGDVWRGRASTGFTEKMGHAAVAVGAAAFARRRSHDQRLHAPLKALLGPDSTLVSDNAR